MTAVSPRRLSTGCSPSVVGSRLHVPSRVWFFCNATAAIIRKQTTRQHSCATRLRQTGRPGEEEEGDKGVFIMNILVKKVFP